MANGYSIISGVTTSGDPVQLRVDSSGNLIMAGYEPNFGKLLVGTAREKFFCTFSSFDTTKDWEVIETGDGMAIASPAGGGAVGSVPYVSINSGATAGARTVIISRSTFRMPSEVRYQISASQRIANNSFKIGFVEVNETTGAIVTDTTFAPGLSVLGARNAAMQEFSGTVATSGTLLTRSGGSAVDSLATAFGTGFTTVATGTTPDFIAASEFSLCIERDKTLTRSASFNVATNAGAQFGNNRVIPDPSKTYKLAIVVENGATAPASSTSWRLHVVNVLDAVRFDVSPRNAGTSDNAKSFPVSIINAPALSASSLLIGDIGVQYRPNTTGAALPFALMSPATPAATAVKASVARLLGVALHNSSASVRSVKFWNTAVAGVTLGTTAALFEVDIPAGGTLVYNLEGGIAFSTALTVAVTGAKGLTDNTAIAANDVTGVIFYI